MWRNIQQGKNRPFCILPDRDYSYADLEQAIGRWLAYFDDCSLARGDRFIIRSADEFAAISCFIAALLDDKVPVNIAADTPLARLKSVAALVDAKCAVHDGAVPIDGLPQSIAQLCLSAGDTADRPAGILARLRGKTRSTIPALPSAGHIRQAALPCDQEGLAYLLFTSGTTSSPTGVQITRGNLFANLETLTRLFAYDRNSRIFNDMFLAHADGIVQGPILAAFTGGAVIRAGGFALPKMEQWLEQVRAKRATHFITVPTIWAMIDAYGAHDDYFDAPECVSLQSVAAKLPQDLWQRIEMRFRHPLASHYGLTETVASALYAGPHPEMGPSASLGLPIDCEARIAPEAGAKGELELRGANVFSGYWRNDKRTHDSFTPDGWFKTGDLAAVNADGSFAILGRLKNIIMSGGFLIRPDEIDEAMMTHPSVRESVTVALEDATFGEIAATALTLDGEASLEELTAHARSNLEGQKVPRRIAVLPAIARGISGKAELQAIIQHFSQSKTPEDAGAGAGAAQLPQKDALEQAVIALAADLFRVKQDMLTLASGPDAVAGWDSFSQLNLVLEAETHFGVRIPASQIARIATLRDIYDAVEGQRS